MTREIKILENLKDMGFQPIENTAILVKYAAPNLSAKIVDFFNFEYYVLQLCQEQLVLIPFSKMTGLLKKEVTLDIPFHTISSIDVSEKGLDYRITIETSDGLLALTAQQKELADFRLSSAYANDTFLGLGSKNWHKDNLDVTLAKLKDIH